jgi:ABC-type dipeptide/oligopeptide/nickel transport systems, permease components
VSPRARYVVRRLLLAIPVIVAMSIFVFLMIHLVPGDPVQTMLGFRATPENVSTVRAQLGLDRPLLAQYLTWAGGSCTGTSGRTSSATRRSRRLLAQRCPSRSS